MSFTRLIARTLSVIGGIGIVVTLAWALVRVWNQGQAGGVSPTVEFWETFCLMFVGLAGCVLLIGQGEMLGQFEAFFRTYESYVADERSSNALLVRNTSTTAQSAPQGMDELIVLMREVRDISLLSDEQRTKRLEALGQAARTNLAHEVPALLREHNWIEARHRVQEARARFPHLPDWDALERQIEQMRAQVEQHDIDAAERQIRELQALGAWDRVGEVLRELLQRHPQSPKANELAQRIRTERHSAETEQRMRIMAQAQESTNRRDWRAALANANTLIQRYPKSPESQALLMQLPTLRENAEIQTRQEVEQQYAGLVKARRFGDALRLAREVIAQYPNSPQAEVMRQQIVQLEQRAVTGR